MLGVSGGGVFRARGPTRGQWPIQAPVITYATDVRQRGSARRTPCARSGRRRRAQHSLGQKKASAIERTGAAAWLYAPMTDVRVRPAPWGPIRMHPAFQYPSRGAASLLPALAQRARRFT